MARPAGRPAGQADRLTDGRTEWISHWMLVQNPLRPPSHLSSGLLCSSKQEDLGQFLAAATWSGRLCLPLGWRRRSSGSSPSYSYSSRSRSNSKQLVGGRKLYGLPLDEPAPELDLRRGILGDFPERTISS